MSESLSTVKGVCCCQDGGFYEWYCISALSLSDMLADLLFSCRGESSWRFGRFRQPLHQVHERSVSKSSRNDQSGDAAWGNVHTAMHKSLQVVFEILRNTMMVAFIWVCPCMSLVCPCMCLVCPCIAGEAKKCHWSPLGTRRVLPTPLSGEWRTSATWLSKPNWREKKKRNVTGWSLNERRLIFRVHLVKYVAPNIFFFCCLFSGAGAWFEDNTHAAIKTFCMACHR